MFANPAEKFRIVLRFLRARRAMPGLCAQAEGRSRELLGAIQSTLWLELSADEKALVRKVEALRRRLRGDRTMIDRMFYHVSPLDRDLPGRQLGPHRIHRESIGRVCRRASRQRLWCLLLFRLIRAFRPMTCLEMGTSLGITAAYQASALKLNGRGRLLTLEGEPTLAALAREHLRELALLENAEVVPGMFEDTLDDVLAGLAPLEFVFFDGVKRGSDLLRDMEKVLPCLADGAVMVFDDICWSPDMETAWAAIAGDRRFAVTVDFRAMGVCLFDRDDHGQRGFVIPIG